MRKIYFPFLLTLFFSMVGISAFAYDAEVDGVYYKLSLENASVTYLNYYKDYYSSNAYAYEGSIIIPESITYQNRTYKVTAIDDYAFYDCKYLTSVSIPTSVASIGASAFENCSGLLSVTIPNSVTAIGASAFQNCTGLLSITIPNSVTAISGSLFFGCSGLSSISIPGSVTSIGKEAFRDCNNLNKVIIEDLSSWCKISFDYSALSSNPLYYAGHLYSDDQTEIKELVIPDGVSSIGGCSFLGCSSISSVTIPNSVTTIGHHAFENCNQINDIHIPSSITTIGMSAFEGCSSLEKVIIDNLSSWLKISFANEQANPLYFAKHLYDIVDREFTELVIPEDVKTINKYAFIGCESITKVTLNSNDVTSTTYDKYSNLGNRFGVAVKEVVFGDNVTAIGAYAFSSSGNAQITVKYTCADKMSAVGTEAFAGYYKIFAKEGTKTVLALWNRGFDINVTDNVIMAKPSLRESSSTQTTLTLSFSGYYNGYTYTLNGKDYDGGQIKLTGLRPGANVNLGILTISLDDVTYQQNYSDYFVTSPISPSVKKKTSTASSLTLKGSYIKGDAEISKMIIKLNNTSIEGDSISITGLNPNTTYRATYTITVKYGDNLEKTYDYTSTSDIKTEALALTTLQPKVVSLGNVIVAAESNIDDEEKNVGFEWRSTDWTDDFASNTGTAYMYEGAMEGYIRNLSTDKLWKFRPYYLSDAGTYYYGDWVGIDPTNTSYFEPTVHTYAKIEITGNTALVKGYSLGGSDEVTVQGFKYWKSDGGSSNRVAAQDIPSTAKTIEATGTMMEVSLSGLDYESSYSYVAFVSTSKGTYYGEIKTFKTGVNSTGINNIKKDNKSTENVHEVARYNMQGRRIVAPEKGINIVKMSDGTTKKVLVK